PRRVALVIPDTAAKVSLLRFEKVPAASDLDQLIRWQMRKAAPFKPEDAQISWVPAAAIGSGGREYLVTLARRDIIESYQRACAGAGAAAGVVDLVSLNLINAALASGGAAVNGDWLVVHVAPDYATLTIVRNKDVIFFRTRHLEAEGDLADLVHQTAMYHEDRLGGARAGARRSAAPRAGRAHGGQGRAARLPRHHAAARSHCRGAGPAGRAGAGARRHPQRAGRVVLRTNLSTRPFYNERAVHVAAGVVAALAIAIAAWQVVRIVRFSQHKTDLNAVVTKDRAEAEKNEREAAQILGKLDKKEVAQVTAAATEANDLINQRTFSWTQLFNELQATMPEDVMLMTIRPEFKDGVT